MPTNPITLYLITAEWAGLFASALYRNVIEYLEEIVYRAVKKSLQILLRSTQAGPGRKVKQGQEEISRNHVQYQDFFSALYRDGKKECKFG